MPTRPARIPQYCHHRASGQAFVHLGGRDVYLGAHGTPQSQAEYRRLIAESLLGQNTAATTAVLEITVNELIDAFWAHAQTYYVKDGKPTGEIQALKYALRPVVELYGHVPVSEFGSLALRTVREQMIRHGYCRPVINRYTHRIRRVFRWGVGHELVTPEILQKLEAVEPLRKGRTTAPEPQPVRPVADEQVEAVLPFVLPPVAAMIRLQRLTGMRPGEVVIMRGCDIDSSSQPWVYRPHSHKCEHHQRPRTIPLGPKARQILQPLLRPDPAACLFCPAEALAEFCVKRRQGRQTKLTPSQAARRPKQRRRKEPGQRYTTSSYGHAITAACRKAGIDLWGPNRLRHTRATEVRQQYDLDTARAILGHSDTRVTEIYAEPDLQRAGEAMEASG